MSGHARPAYSEGEAIAEARRLRAAGIELAKAPHLSEFEVAVDLIRRYARHHELLSINELRDEFDEFEIPQSLRGPSFAGAVRRGFITPVDARTSTGLSAHGKPIAVYRSQLYTPEGVPA